MTYKKLVPIMVALLGLSLSSEARPKDPRRERARCDSALRLCKDVAGIDYRNCSRGRHANCSADYNEDISSCNSDHRDCISRI